MVAYSDVACLFFNLQRAFAVDVDVASRSDCRYPVCGYVADCYVVDAITVAKTELYAAVGDIYFSSAVNSSYSYRAVSRVDVEVSVDSRVFCRNCNAVFADSTDSYVVGNFILNGKLSPAVFVMTVNGYAVGVCYCKLAGVNRNLRVQLATAGKFFPVNFNGVINLVEAFEFIDRNVNRTITREVCLIENYCISVWL